MAERKVSANFSTAMGHTCAINRFDTDTVMVPFNENELRRLINEWDRRMKALTASGDYPERVQDEATMYNLQTAAWMLTRK